jgi:hypothetical protein
MKTFIRLRRWFGRECVFVIGLVIGAGAEWGTRRDEGRHTSAISERIQVLVAVSVLGEHY